MTTPAWAALCGDLPDHDTEMTSAHGGQPTIAEQSKTHGAGLPPRDYGTDDRKKLVAT